MENVVPFYFPTAPCCRWGVPSRVTAMSQWVLGDPWTILYLGSAFSTDTTSTEVKLAKWMHCSLHDQPPGIHYQRQYGCKTGTKYPFFFVEASWQWQQRWCVGCSKLKGWGARYHCVSWEHPDERNVHTQPFSCLPSLGKTLYCTKCLRVSVQWSDNITNQSRKVLKMCENGKEIPIH